MNRFGGIRIIQDRNCTSPGGYYFKPSRHRSRRLQKKLLKKYGSMQKPDIPTAYHVRLQGQQEALMMHPDIYRELVRKADQQDVVQPRNFSSPKPVKIPFYTAERHSPAASHYRMFKVPDA